MCRKVSSLDKYLLKNCYVPGIADTVPPYLSSSTSPPLLALLASAMPQTAQCNHTGGPLLRSFFLSLWKAFPRYLRGALSHLLQLCSDWTFSVRLTPTTLFIIVTRLSSHIFSEPLTPPYCATEPLILNMSCTLLC